MSEQIDLSDFPPFPTVTILRNGRRMNFAQPDDEIITVLRPSEREARVVTK